MKNTVRTCILLASFSLPSLALAQPSLTLYGVADSGFGYEGFRYKGQGQSVTVSNVGLQESYLKTSRWGLKGTETISSNLNVFFNFEQEIKLLTGQAGKVPRGFNRKSVLGLSSKSFGTLSFGRQKHSGKTF
ncbi:porin [Orrella sp. 11846]|uniref:porin n=1 Tax=Orrella sp. 11846 TaxID=3409913 RepID=UPI003B5C8438